MEQGTRSGHGAGNHRAALFPASGQQGEIPEHGRCGTTDTLDPLHCGHFEVQGRQDLVCFRNEGNQPVRILDEINDGTADYFFLTLLRTEQGDARILNAELGKMTFQRPLNYRELAPGQEYNVTIPVCLDEVELEDWKQCSCELETSYYNQQGKDCLLGVLQATTKLAL